MLWLAVMAFQVAPNVDAMMARYHALTRATVECNGARPDDILICARRAADKWRVPLIERDFDDPKNMPVMVERERLLARTNNCQEKTPFLVGCGKAGIIVSSRSGVSLIGQRPLAP